MHAIMNTYGRLPVTFTSGQGSWLTDSEGKQYLDALSGIAVCGLGHAHPAVTKALCEQADKLIHTSNLYGIERQQALAEALRRVSGMDNVFFSNSGAEANEAAIKIARKYGHDQGIHEAKIVVMSQSFHGRTLATLSATGNAKVHEGFGPLVSGFVRVPYNDIDALSAVVKADPQIVAVLLEPVQGEGGLATASADYLKAVRALCDERNLLMMLDEIQTGNGRTGSYFCYQQFGFYPDVLTTAKGLGNGVPIGACLARGKASQVLQPGNHGSTYGGNPLACATALTVVDTLINENLADRAAVLGERMLTRFNEALGGLHLVKNIRGKGLMIGIELSKPCGELVSRALENKLLINVTSDSVIRLLPALIMSDEEADQVANSVIELVQSWAEEQ